MFVVIELLICCCTTFSCCSKVFNKFRVLGFLQPQLQTAVNITAGSSVELRKRKLDDSATRTLETASSALSRDAGILNQNLTANIKGTIRCRGVITEKSIQARQKVTGVTDTVSLNLIFAVRVPNLQCDFHTFL
jgi:hypothetical protein